MPNDVFQPLHVSDFVDAVKKVMDDGKGHVYNVCGSAQISAERLYQLIHLQENLQERAIRWVNPSCTTLADSSLIRQELGWGDSRNLVEQLQRGEITYERAPAKGRKKKKRAVPTDIRQMAGNLLLFVVFFVLSPLCSSHTMFSQVGWLMIYVILVFILCNICQRARLDLGMLKDEYEDLKAINEEDVRKL